MTPRIAKLAGQVRSNKHALCFERAALFTESFKATEGEPQVLRVAKGLGHVLENMTIFIDDGELVVGNTASKPMGVEVTIESGIWPQEELQQLRREGWTISDEDTETLRSLSDYWSNRIGVHLMGRLFNERLWPYVQSGVFPPGWTTKTASPQARGASTNMPTPVTYVHVDYEKVLNRGFGQLITEAEDELRELRFTDATAVGKADFLRAAIISYEALIKFSNRFAHLALELTATEPQASRRDELRRIAETCRRVPREPARTFREAVQCYWFLYMILTSGVTPLGRFDQIMYPFYDRDRQAGTTTDPEVVELLQSLRIKDMQTTTVHVRADQRAKWSGGAKWHNMVIGGVTADGRDATNDLTYLILQAASTCPLPHHTIAVRIHESTPDQLIRRALETVKSGGSVPQFLGDKSHIEFFLANGVPIQHARDYAVAGCIEPIIPAKARIGWISLMVVPLVLDFFMHGGIDQRGGRHIGPSVTDFASFESMDELVADFKDYLAEFIRLEAESNTINIYANSGQRPNALASSLLDGGMKAGVEQLERDFSFDPLSPISAVGMINVADSLAAIKSVVFEQGLTSLTELKSALDANWEGERNQQIRKLCLSAPKFGNDDDYVDEIARDLYRFWADAVSSLGRKHVPAGVSITAHNAGGVRTGATPDGRLAGDRLADGSVSPAQGRDARGVEAVIRSAAKIDQVPYLATLLNLKFHPDVLDSDQGVGQLCDLIRGYFATGGKHVQCNIVDRETLLDAQANPEAHQDLIVGVIGYSAYFVQLSKAIQDEIIDCTEHRLSPA